MAKKIKKSSKSEPAVVENGKDKKGKSKKNDNVKESEADIKAANKAKNLANRAKVTSTTSWTGKLPHTLLHELCQKRKWGKVEYDMKKIGDKGMAAIAKISYVEPKTKEVLSVRLTDPTYDKVTGKTLNVPQETPMEARHIAATIALYRIAYNTNMQMMLPPNHKNIWYDLIDYRTALLAKDAKRAARLFDIDPFKTLLEDRKLENQLKIEQIAKSKQNDKVEVTPINITMSQSTIKKPTTQKVKSSNLPQKETAKNPKLEHLDSDTQSFPKKIWEEAAFIDLEESDRQIIETTLRSHIDWRSKKRKINDTATEEEKTALRLKLLELNFRASHVNEAMEYQDPLSFLLFNLPEDDLPNYFHKRKEDTKNSITVLDNQLSVRMAMERLAESGVPEEEALSALKETNLNEAEAAGILTRNAIPHFQAALSLVSEKDSSIIWKEELDSLKSIYPEQIEVVDSNCYMMKVIEKLHIKVKVYKTKNYPSTLPGIIISTFDKRYAMPNYIKQKILQNLLQYIKDFGLLNDMLVYNIYEWLVDNCEKIIKNPGPLLLESADSLTSPEKNAKSTNGNRADKVSKKHSFKKKLTVSEIEKLRNDHEKKIVSQPYHNMIDQRKQLPAWSKQELITKMIFENDVVLITGETGSGKSTQVVQFVLDHLLKNNDYDKTNIICTQPRRISAIGLAERVSDERCSSCGDEVGYIIRGANKTTNSTRIKFMTTGVLVRMLQTDKNLLENSVVMIDEVHERSIDTDLIVILLKNLLGKIQGLKIVLMSATVNVDIFKNYFKGLKSCHIEGRTFPIKDYFLDDILKFTDFKIKREKSFDNELESDDGMIIPTADSKFFRTGQINYDLIFQTALHIHTRLIQEKNDGSIIIFLPGVAEITKCCNLLKRDDHDNSFQVLPLHSALTPDEQKKVFIRYRNKRKIVVSTNIAETSITIDDCVATIDSGKAKIMCYNPQENTTRLIEKFISRAEAKQRRGRAGRVREGYSFKLYSKRLFEEDMVDMPTPEIKRISLESLYLTVKAMGVKTVKSFLATGLDCPPLEAINKAENMLVTVGLLNSLDNSLTQLGRYVSMLPVMDSRHGKLLLYSLIFGFADVGVLIASVLTIGQSPFVGGIDSRDAIKNLLSQFENRGDLLSTVEIVSQYLDLSDSSSKKNFLSKNYLSYNKVRDIVSSRTQFYSNLKEFGFLPFDYKPNMNNSFNRNRKNWTLIKAVLTGAFYPNVARVQLPDAKFMSTGAGAIEKDPEARLIKYWIRNEKFVDKLLDKTSSKTVSQRTKKDERPILPASRAFIHPSSILFSSNSVTTEDSKTLSIEDQPTLKTSNNTSIIKYPFVVFSSANVTSKLFLREITPTSTLSLLLFGGTINYEVNGANHSPGIVLDNWLPIRTWCKNGVLITELRDLLDDAIRDKLEVPESSVKSSNLVSHSSDVVIEIVEKMIANN